MLFPVSSAIAGIANGSPDGIFNICYDHIMDWLYNIFTPEKEDVGQTEDIPTINGAKNRSGANGVIPLLIGESMYTPVLAAQTYTDIDPTDGTDGENQYFHSLYCLGYNNIDLKSVSLGIYPLSIDRHNGTSGSLDCENLEKQIFTQDITKSFDATDTDLVKGNTTLELPIVVDDYDVLSVNSIVSSNLKAYGRAEKVNITRVLWRSVEVPLIVTTERTISSVTISGNKLVVTVSDIADDEVLLVKGDVTVNATIQEQKATVHYDKNIYAQQLELQQGENEVSLFPQKVVQESFGTELMHPEGTNGLVIPPFSAKYPQKVQLEVMFQNLVRYDDDGDMKDEEVTIGTAYSVDGGLTYQPFVAFTQSSQIIRVTDEGTGTFSDGSGTYRITKFKGKKNKAMRFIAEKTFTFEEVFNTENQTVLKNNVIEFKIFRISTDYSTTDSKHQYKCYFSAIRTWCYDYKLTKESYEEGGSTLVPLRPIIEKYRNMTARLGFKIKASDALKGTIDELNVIQESRARYCTITENNGEKTYTWSNINDTVPTNNPAALALMILQHPMRGEYVYSDDEIDLDSFGRFYEWCNQTDLTLLNSDGRRYTANGVISKQFKTVELVNQILGCGHAKLVINGNKYGVVYDKPLDTPVMVLNNQNILEQKNTKNFAEDIDGFTCKYIDSLNDYQEDTQICVPKNLLDPNSPDYKDPDDYKLESMELPFITDIGRAYRACMYSLASRKLHPETWEIKVGVEGNLIDIGSLVSVQNDTLSVGIGDGAEITNVNTSNGEIVSVVVDYGFNVVDTTKTYGLQVQHSDIVTGVSVRTFKLASFSQVGVQKTLVFDEPITLGLVSVGDIVSFGLFEKITTDAICTNKKSNNDGTFVFNFVPYQKDIYDAEFGELPEFVSNVTSAKDAGVEVSEDLPVPTFGDIQTVARAVSNEGSDTPPSTPTDFSIVPYENYLEFSCLQTGSELKDSVKYYEFEITRGDGETPQVIKSASNNFNYLFDRLVDGYPEASDLADWTFRVRVTNVFNVSSEWVSGTITQQALQNYGTWLLPNITVSKEVVDRTVILTAVYGGSSNVYGKIKTLVKIKRKGNLDPVETGSQTTFNDVLGITPDSQYYTPEFNASVQTDPMQDNEGNYRTNDTTAFESYSNKITHTLPLIGQTYRLFKEGNRFTGVYTKDVPDVADISELPHTPPQEGDAIHWTGEDYYETVEVGQETESVLLFTTGGYYYFENSAWVQVQSKALIVPTTYTYSLQLTNESGNVSNEIEIDAEALCTNIADIVHSHEHYKDLYVEKLSAINANIGIIKQGGFGSFDELLNYWALSDLSAEDSGVVGGVKKGAFRVGGVDQYFKVTPDPVHAGQYEIELRAGNISLTSSTGANFNQGTFIYEGDETVATKRMALTATGIVAQKLVNGNWINAAKVQIDGNGNLIVSNSEDEIEFGFRYANANIYHFDTVANQDENGNNQQNIICTGQLQENTELNPILPLAISPRSFSGTIEKDISGYVGKVLCFTKASAIEVDRMLNIDGTQSANAETYNSTMSEEKGQGTVGSYLGLTASQISSGIFESVQGE